MSSPKANEIAVAPVPEVEAEPAAHHDFKTAKRVAKDVEVVYNGPTVDDEVAREAALTALTAEEEKKLIRRIDWRLVPLLCLLYFMKKIDETNASNARIMNKGTDRNILTQLNITSDEFGLITVIYTVPYIVAEIPSNLLLKRVTPSRWQSRIMISWGIVTACTAAVTNKGGLYTVRFLLGLTEAGMFPAIILQLSYWYRPDEIAQRLVAIYCVGNTSGILGGLLAYAFNGASGAGNLSGWQWLFVVEGIITILMGFVVWFFLPDFPATTKWLTPTESAFLQARLPRASPRAAEENFVLKEVLRTLKDKRLWLFTLCWACMTSGSGGVKFYQPTIIANMGFSDIATAQILNIPMSVLAIILIIVLGWTADRARIPLPLLPIGGTIVIVACYSVLLAYPNDIGVYIAMMIGNACSSAWFPLMWTWRSQTINGATGSAFAIGFVNSYGQVGDAVGPQMFEDKYEPRYQLPFGLSMGLVAGCSITSLYTWWVTRQTEQDTRRHKLARLEAKKRDEAVLDDITDRDLRKRGSDSDSAATRV
ncbi:major facilitator superfamily domain-containing protein [Aspergillus karnatakaensis]|uniref:major facilitator superfamily domain-containing protein n=1 Tax=Aspergillus karnatakaensis TaxID=1810916 RepID=UPI003CCD0EFF